MPSAAPGPQVNPIHIVLGGAAAGCLQAACADCGMPGSVVGFLDDLAHDPLIDGAPCAADWRSQRSGTVENAMDTDADLSPWHAIHRQLNLQRSDAVVIWIGDNVADAVFLAMACERLSGLRDVLLQVRVPGIDGHPFVAMHSPAQLARLYATRRILSAADQVCLAEDFLRICDTCSPVRRLEQGRVVGVPMDYYDPLLLAACGPDWRGAMSVVGTAMRHCDAPNLLGDDFFSARLGFLVDVGHVEATGPGLLLRERLVRAVQSANAAS